MLPYGGAVCLLDFPQLLEGNSVMESGLGAEFHSLSSYRSICS